MINERVERFSFWQPIVFTLSDNPGRTAASRWGYTIGSLADQFASLSQQTFSVEVERINARKLYFEIKETQDVPLCNTALKICLYVLSAGTLLLIALVVKAIFKYHLNSCRVLTKQSPNEVFAEKQIGKTKIVLLYGSITDETTDVIVNAANATLKAGGGVCGVIHGDAGDVPFDECEEILKNHNRDKLNCGEAVLTSSGDLAPRIKAIIHAVGPNYNKAQQKANGTDLLIAAYRNSLEIAYDPQEQPSYVSKPMQDKVLHSIAFPSISTGIFAAPLDEAAPIAIQTIKEFVEEFPDAFEEVRFVFLPLNKDSNTAPAYQRALDKLE